MKENYFTHTKKEVDNILQKLKDADYVDDLALLANTPTQAESLLCCLEPAAEGIGFYVNANKTEFMRLKQKGVIPTLSDKSQKLSDQFPYLSSNISSTESDVNIYLLKV